MRAVLLASRIASLLYGVEPFDAVTLASVSVLLATVAILASFVPALRRATQREHFGARLFCPKRLHWLNRSSAASRDERGSERNEQHAQSGSNKAE